MGEPKALLELDGTPLIAHHVKGLMRVCDHVAVVLGAHRERIAPVVPPDATVVVNPHWDTTEMSGSVRIAVTELEIVDDLVVTPVDVLPAPLATLTALCAGSAPAVVVMDGRRGHPVRLGRQAIASVRAGPLVTGLRGVLQAARPIEVRDPRGLGDFDDPEAWSDALRRWVGRAGPTG